MLGVKVIGFSGGVYNRNGVEAEERTMLSKVDVSFEAAKTSSLVSVSCHLSDVNVHLAYSDYVTAFIVLRENIGRASDKKSWDNLEVAWEQETASDDKTIQLEPFSKEVSYAADARHVRYGTKKKPVAKRVKPSYDFRFRFNALSVLLRRDAALRSSDPLIEYDMVLLRGDGFEASMTSSSDGDQSLEFSLHRIFVYDLGDSGRMLRGARDGVHGKGRPSAFSVLVDGYSPPEKEGGSGGHLDAQVIASMDRHSSSPGDVKVSILINYLSIVALAQPFEEVIAFLSREWPVSDLAQALSTDTESLDGHVGESPDDTAGGSVVSSAKSLQVKFVLHYPRFVFVADESDPHSRGLVLRG